MITAPEKVLHIFRMVEKDQRTYQSRQDTLPSNLGAMRSYLSMHRFAVFCSILPRSSEYHRNELIPIRYGRSDLGDCEGVVLNTENSSPDQTKSLGVRASTSSPLM